LSDGPGAVRADAADSAGWSRIVTPAAVCLVEARSARRERLARAVVCGWRRATIRAGRAAGAARSGSRSASRRGARGAGVSALRARPTIVLARAAARVEGDQHAEGSVITSMDLVNWTLIPNSPRSSVVTGDGETMFSSVTDLNPSTPYYTSSDGVIWAAYPSSKLGKGSWTMKYDLDHHLLYSSNGTAGFWRVRTAQ
jgi:hypothetical protein